MISIIIPVYNKEPYIKKCLNSIINQKYKDFEAIIVDDGSKDKSRDICEKVIGKDKRFRIYSIENHGVSYARNFGIKKARGEKIVFIDADDYVGKNFLSDLNKFDYDLVIEGIRTGRSTTGYGKIISFESQKISKDELLSKSDYIRLLSVVYGKLYKRSIISGNVRFNESMNFGEDTCFVLDYVKKSKTFYLLNKNDYYNVLAQDTLSRKYIPNLERQLIEINKKITDKNSYWSFRNYKLLLINESQKGYEQFRKGIKEYQKRINWRPSVRSLKKDMVIYILCRLKQ